MLDGPMRVNAIAGLLGFSCPTAEIFIAGSNAPRSPMKKNRVLCLKIYLTRRPENLPWSRTREESASSGAEEEIGGSSRRANATDSQTRNDANIVRHCLPGSGPHDSGVPI